MLPLIYYQPFKAAHLYLSSVFPETNHDNFGHKLFYAEQYWNVIHDNDKKYAETTEHQDFSTFLMSKCLVFPVPYVPIHNFFVLHFAFRDYKIAINYHLTRMSKPFDSKASQRQRLANIVLKQEGWEIWDLTEKEFSEWET